MEKRVLMFLALLVVTGSMAAPIVSTAIACTDPAGASLPVAVPEPTSLLLLGAGIAGMALLRKKIE